MRLAAWVSRAIAYDGDLPALAVKAGKQFFFYSPPMDDRASLSALRPILHFTDDAGVSLKLDLLQSLREGIPAAAE